MPKYVQKSQITTGNELEVLIHPDGVLPVITFLKENQKMQYHSFTNVTAVDVPSRPYRFEVNYFSYSIYIFINLIHYYYRSSTIYYQYVTTLVFVLKLTLMN